MTYAAAALGINVDMFPVVSGGTLASDATYYYRTFTANGTLEVSAKAVNFDVLVISGAGGGGGFFGGGGGAGGVSLFSLSSMADQAVAATSMELKELHLHLIRHQQLVVVLARVVVLQTTGV